MKTTVEIQDALLEEARSLAASRATTLRKLIEDGLRLVLRQNPAPQAFRLPDCSYEGDGLSEHYADASWADLRETIYGESK
jgi:hypothetical protein